MVPSVLSVDLRFPLRGRLLDRLFELRLVRSYSVLKDLQVSLDQILEFWTSPSAPSLSTTLIVNALRPIATRLDGTVIDDGAIRNVSASPTKGMLTSSQVVLILR